MTATDQRAVSVVEAADLAGWAEAWDDLAAAAPHPSPFLRSWWLESVAGGQVTCLLVVDGSTLLGGLALERARRPLGAPYYRVLGGGKLCPDHLDLVAHPDRVDEVVAALREWFDAPGARLLDLEGLRDDARVLEVVAPARPEQVDVAPYGALPTSYEEYLASRSKNFRRQARKYPRQVAERGVVCRRVEGEEALAALDDFEALHSVREDRTELMREMPRLRRALAGAVRAGEAIVYVAEHEGRCGAVKVMFSAGASVCCYQTARSMDPVFDHVGTVLDLLAVSDAIESGVGEFDFLRGAEQYKSSFVDTERVLLRVRAARGVRARLVLSMLRASDALRDLMKRLLRRG